MNSHESVGDRRFTAKMRGIVFLVVTPCLLALVCSIGILFPDPVNRYSIAILLGLGWYVVNVVLALPFAFILLRELEALRTRIHLYDLTLGFVILGVLSFVGMFLPLPLSLVSVSVLLGLIVIQLGTIVLYVLVRFIWPFGFWLFNRLFY